MADAWKPRSSFLASVPSTRKVSQHVPHRSSSCSAQDRWVESPPGPGEFTLQMSLTGIIYHSPKQATDSNRLVEHVLILQNVGCHIGFWQDKSAKAVLSRLNLLHTMGGQANTPLSKSFSFPRRNQTTYNYMYVLMVLYYIILHIKPIARSLEQIFISW